MNMSLFFRFTFLCISIFVYCSAYSQNREGDNGWSSAISSLKKAQPYYGRYSPNSSTAGHCLLNKPRIIDSSYLEITYIADVLLDTLGTRRTKDVVVVQVGDSVQKYYGRICWQRNMNYTLFELGEGSKQRAINSIYQPAIDYAIYRDMKQKKFLNRHLLPRVNNMIYEYKESIPHFNWQITSDTLTIAGYLCHKAKTHYAGRQWTVWFTSQIPIDCGLWKFNGLPGLIMQAYDIQDYFHFRIHTISQSKTPILLYDIQKKQVTRDVYRSTEQKLYRHPFSGDSMDFIMVPNPETKQMEFLPDEWEIPYNPIERE